MSLEVHIHEILVSNGSGFSFVRAYKLPAAGAIAEMSVDTNEPTQVPGLVRLFGTRSRGWMGKTWPLEK